MRSKVQQREEQESARLYEKCSMHGQAVLICLCASLVLFCVIFFKLRHFLFSCNGLSIHFSFFPSVDHLLNGYIC